MDPDAVLERHPSQSERQPGRLHGRPGGFEHSPQVARRAGAGLKLVGVQPDERLHAMALDCADCPLPRPHLDGIGGDPEPALAPEMGVDVVPSAECLDLAHDQRGNLSETYRLRAPAHPLEGQILVPQRHREAAVAAAGAGAAQVGLQQEDIGGRLQLLDPDRRPQAREAAADDAYVRGGLPVQRRTRGQPVGRLTQPPAPFGERDGRAQASSPNRCPRCTASVRLRTPSFR